MGPEMMNQFRAQAERFGTRFITDDADRVELTDGGVQTVCVGDDEYRAKSRDPGDGRRAEAARHPRRDRARRPRRLHLRRLRRRLLQGRGRRRDRRRRLGDGGLDLRLQVRQRADDRPPPRRVPRLEDHARPRPRAGRTSSSRPRTCRRSSSPATTASSRTVRLRNAETGETEELEVGGAFVAIGHIPRSELVAGPGRHRRGRLRASPRASSTRTNLAGVFAVGDLVDHTYRQAVTAAGTGCKGALDAEWYLRDTPPSPEAHWLPRRRAGRGRADPR